MKKDNLLKVLTNNGISEDDASRLCEQASEEVLSDAIKAIEERGFNYYKFESKFFEHYKIRPDFVLATIVTYEPNKPLIMIVNDAQAYLEIEDIKQARKLFQTPFDAVV